VQIRPIWWLIGGVGLAYAVRRFAQERRLKRALGEIVPDQKGHYDIDGVSYDQEEAQVVVSSDARAPEPGPWLH
jgi:hypothetical protein